MDTVAWHIQNGEERIAGIMEEAVVSRVWIWVKWNRCGGYGIFLGQCIHCYDVAEKYKWKQSGYDGGGVGEIFVAQIFLNRNSITGMKMMVV